MPGAALSRFWQPITNRGKNLDPKRAIGDHALEISTEVDIADVGSVTERYDLFARCRHDTHTRSLAARIRIQPPPCSTSLRTFDTALALVVDARMSHALRMKFTTSAIS